MDQPRLPLALGTRRLGAVSTTFRVIDVVGNILLFVPLGVTTALMVRRRPVLSAALLAFVLSISAETLQLYSHSRYPSATDLVCNVAGALAGAGLLRRLTWT